MDDLREPMQRIGSGPAQMLRDYRERRREFHVFDNYDEAVGKTRERMLPKCQELEDPLKTIALRLFSITDKAAFLLQVCEWKMDYVAETLIHSIEAHNPLALANGTRSLVEHLGALAAILCELEQLEDSLRGQGSEAVIDRALDRTETFLHRAYYGKSPKLAKSKAEQAHHVNDFLEALRHRWGDIDDVYNFLCEYVHPNYGSNTLVSTGEIAHGRLNPPETFIREVLVRLHYYGGRCMIHLRDIAIKYGRMPRTAPKPRRILLRPWSQGNQRVCLAGTDPPRRRQVQGNGI